MLFDGSPSAPVPPTPTGPIAEAQVPGPRGRIAAIDIGSNSIHVVVVEPRQDSSYRQLAKAKYMVKLGRNAFETHRISDAAFAAGLEAAEYVEELMRGLEVTDVVAVATSAVREAKNGKAFTTRFEEITGTRPKIISGRQEAQLIARAVSEALPLEDLEPLLLDIGGGSTELAVVREAEKLAWSLPLGVQRLLGHVESSGPIDAVTRAEVEARIDASLAEPLRRAAAHGVDALIGTSGTLEALGELVRQRRKEPAWPTPTGATVDGEELQRVAHDLCASTVEERMAMGVDERRADAIHLGALVATAVLKRLRLRHLTLCDDALREGMILQRLRPAPPRLAQLPPDERAVRELAERAGCDVAQGEHVAFLATQLFRGTRPLHHLGDDALRVLAAAARLRTVGQWLAFRRYHKHTRYIVWNADLRGFSPRERLLLGHVARYHRKKAPKRSQKKLSRVDREGQDLIMTLAGLLRVAAALDRSRCQAVEDVVVHDDGETLTLTLKVGALRPIRLELEAARAMKKTMEACLGRDVRIELPDVP